MRKKSRKCANPNCGCDISSYRANAVVCSAKCRVAFNRTKRRAFDKLESTDFSTAKKPLHLSLEFCAAHGCNEYVQKGQKTCSSSCRSKVWRSENPAKAKALDAKKTTQNHILSAELTAIYFDLETEDQRLELIQKSLRMAVKGKKNDTLLLDGMAYRAMFRSIYLVKGKDSKGNTVRHNGKVPFPQIVTEYLRQTYECNFKEYLEQPDMPKATYTAFNAKFDEEETFETQIIEEVVGPENDSEPQRKFKFDDEDDSGKEDRDPVDDMKQSPMNLIGRISYKKGKLVSSDYNAPSETAPKLPTAKKKIIYGLYDI